LEDASFDASSYFSSHSKTGNSIRILLRTFFLTGKEQASIQTVSIIQSKGSSTQQPIEIKKGDLSCNANPLFYKEISM